MVDKKGAIGLSINMIVVVVISIVMLGLGITMLYNFIGSAEDIKGDLDQRTSQELERLLVDQGKKVALPLHRADVERGDNHVFGIGILNIGGVGDEFRINAEFVKAVDENNEIISDVGDVNSWLFYNEQSTNIKEGDHYKEPIMVAVSKDAPKGQYIFNANVYAGEELYGNKQNFYVYVK